MTIYLDAAATTPVDADVIAAMVDVMKHGSANPSSAHWAGRRADSLVRMARERVAALTGFGPANVIFTSGATEANNIVLRGLTPATSYGVDRRGRHAIVSAHTEHPSVLATLRDLAERGADVRLLDVDSDGRIDPNQLGHLIDDDTSLVSLMAANNETGVLLDIATVADITHAAGALLHVDASQLLAWGPISPEIDVDLMTVSGHKMHGPQGVGALVATRAARQRLRPLLTGGGQESGLRSGTTNVAGVVGLGLAAHHATLLGPQAATRVAGLRDHLHQALTARLESRLGEGLPRLNGHAHYRLPGVVNLAFGNDDAPIDAEQILAAAPHLAASTGSACSAGMPGPSPVLLAMGCSVARAESSIRFSLSRFTTMTDVEAAVDAISHAVDLISTTSLVGASTITPRAQLP